MSSSKRDTERFMFTAWKRVGLDLKAARLRHVENNARLDEHCHAAQWGESDASLEGMNECTA